ncbi:MAG: MBL fold metallo-hydrolase, partial [Polaromonas sp.]|nr:MBL fold metallo-hydrolase [Polaromonas sp.]
MKVRVLGCSGAIARDCRTTSFLLDHDVLVDAGTGVGDLTLDEMRGIDHVLLTHSHLDHVAALPLMVDAIAAQRT